MTLKSYFDSLPDLKKELIEKLSIATDSSVSTVYRWLSGEIDPPMVKKRIISAIVDIPLDELFPTTEKIAI